VIKTAEVLTNGTRLFRRLLADPRVPRPVKWLLTIAVLPIPGPVDELAGAAAAWWLTRHAPQLVAEHWNALVRDTD
jgi:ABC-type sulfate transport system permease subunit